MYKIGEVAELTGMGIHTLRYYEKLGLLPPSTRNSGIRQQTEGDVRLLKFLYSLKQTGMSLEEIAQIGAARTSLFFNLVPVVTMLISFIEGVNITPAQCIGMILVVTGVLYSSGFIQIKSKESVSI